MIQPETDCNGGQDTAFSDPKMSKEEPATLTWTAPEHRNCIHALCLNPTVQRKHVLPPTFLKLVLYALDLGSASCTIP